MLRLRAKHTEIVHSHLCRAYPEEGCGVLLGRDLADGREVERVIGFENVREDSRNHRYLIAPEQFLSAEREARASGLDVIGFFHSHPDHPAFPSRYDLEHAFPFFSYVILAVDGGEPREMRSFVLSEDRSEFLEERLERKES